MPKAPREEKGNTTPKKRARKVAPANGNGVHAENGNGSVMSPVAASLEVSETVEVLSNPVVLDLDEQIRVRAYEIYKQRNGHGGSPEQDWLRARQEICGQ
jgi:hypothetical protein